ncbi:transporter substrate-binding domain-containing protein [Parvibaculaceae bacterium PLY_AMNH_Bact1]|nr:transporter substrate-binding domain-containing protein [Parvibaculaceae bacterium PLY_AMNH_Bact1]
MVAINAELELIGSALDHTESLRHSPPMRWLLLINLLAVVLLSGAVAIVIEGTPVGTGTSSTLSAILDDTNPLVEGIQESAEAHEPMSALQDDADVTTDQTSISEPENREAEVEASHVEPARIANDIGLVAAPDAPIPLPAPRTKETETVEAEPAEIEPRPITRSDAEQDKNDEPAPLVVATEGDFAPFNYVDVAGKPAGFDIDIAKELCGRLERQCVFEVRPWADLIPSLRRGDIDLIAASMRIPSTRPDGVMFSNPYYGSRGRFVSSKGAGISGPGLLRVAGSQIAVQQGSVHEAYLEAQFAEVDLVRTRSLSEALQNVLEGKVEAAFGDNAAVLRWATEQACCTTLGNPISDESFFGEGIGLVVQEKDRVLLDALNAQLQEMLTDGTSGRLSDRYFGGSIY